MPNQLPDLRSSGTDIELLFCTEVLGLRSLHYGYWDNGEELTLENLRRAQDRFTERLLAVIPAGVRRILDVGCGTGDIARLLAANGFEVTAISPDATVGKTLQQGTNGITYVNSKFEDLAIDRSFDLILMAESQNYFEARAAFAQCRRYLPAGGHLLVSGIFGRADVPRSEFPAFVKNTDRDFACEGSRHGFHLRSSEDITTHVLPTLRFCRATFDQYVVPTIRIAGLWLSRHRIIGTLMRFALNGQIKSLRGIRGHYIERFDDELFARTCCYVTQLFVYVPKT